MKKTFKLTLKYVDKEGEVALSTVDITIKGHNTVNVASNLVGAMQTFKDTCIKVDYEEIKKKGK